MVRISVDIDEALNLRLMAYAVKTKGKSHGVKGQVIAEIVRDFLKPQWEMAASGDDATAPAKAGKGTAEIVVEKDLANEPVKARSRNKPKRKSPIAEDDQIKIKESWDTSEDHNISAIAKQFPQYSDRQVRHWIDRNLRPRA